MYLYTFYEAVLGGGDSRIHKLKEVSTEYLLANELGHIDPNSSQVLPSRVLGRSPEGP